MEQTTQLKGALTEQKCFVKCLESGFNISKPIFDNARYDFILDAYGKLFKIQIKSSRWADEDHSSFIFNCYSQHSTGNGNKRMKYTNQEIDYFMVECENNFYLYPAPEVGMTEKRLRIIPPKSGQVKGICFAKDYLFEEVSKNF